MALKCNDGAVEPLFSIFQVERAKFRNVVKCFALDLTATQPACMTGLSLRSVNAIFLRMRRKIAAECERVAAGRRAGGRRILLRSKARARQAWPRSRRENHRLRLAQARRQVYTAIVPNASKAALEAVIRGRASLSSGLHTDGWVGYEGLVHLGYSKHLRVQHREDEFAFQLNHINGIESFWSLA